MFDAKAFLKNVATLPGVYQMYDVQSNIIYIGKAKNLKNRLSSYFNKNVAPKTKTLVEQIADIKVTITHSENEALVLECNLIKEHRPKYNILMRDDKSYPYIILTQHQYPKLDVYRGTRYKQAEYFGPYPNATAVRQTLKLLQKLFKLRQCTDSFFKQRNRPCLQYQIGRCSGPCVKKIMQDDYQKDVELARLFLQGKSQAIVGKLIEKMDVASEELRYEQAAKYRDLIAQLKEIQSQQYVNKGHGKADVLAIAREGILASVALMKIRDGQVVASQCYHPRVPVGMATEEILASFISQFYLVGNSLFGIANKIIINLKLEDQALLSETLSQYAKHKVIVSVAQRGDAKKWLEIGVSSAKQDLQQTLASKMRESSRWQQLQNELNLAELPERIECFDISHHSGESTKASCVVFNKEGAVKSDYRQFNIKEVAAADDYAAMHQAIKRRYERLVREEAKIPDIVLIDGGKGQLSEAISVFEELQLIEVRLIAIAKGPTRKAGFEQLFMPEKKHAITLKPDSPALHLLQQIRDEAHRFAITGVKQQRQKKRNTSTLENIPGVGAKRRRELLRQFGGLHGLKKASREEIAKVSNINKALAQKIYDYFHS